MPGINHQTTEKGNGAILEALALNNQTTFSSAFKKLVERYVEDVKHKKHNLEPGKEGVEWVIEARNESLHHLFNSIFMTATSRFDMEVITQDQLRSAVDLSFTYLESHAPFFETHMSEVTPPSRNGGVSSELRNAIIELWDADENSHVRKAVSGGDGWEPVFITRLRNSDTAN